MTWEAVFSIVTVVVTTAFGYLFKNRIVPSKYIPLQNLIIGVIAAVLAIVLDLFDNTTVAIITSLGMAFGAGGFYDFTKSTFTKEDE